MTVEYEIGDLAQEHYPDGMNAWPANVRQAMLMGMRRSARYDGAEVQELYSLCARHESAEFPALLLCRNAPFEMDGRQAVRQIFDIKAMTVSEPQ